MNITKNSFEVTFSINRNCMLDGDFSQAADWILVSAIKGHLEPYSWSIEVKWSEGRSVVSDSLRLQGLYSPGILQARILDWVAFPFSRGIFPTQGSNPGLLHCRWILYQIATIRGSMVYYRDLMRVEFKSLESDIAHIIDLLIPFPNF